MCSELERIKDEGRAEGLAEGLARGCKEGALEHARDTALELATTFGFSAGQIAKAVSVDEKTITQWLAEAEIDR